MSKSTRRLLVLILLINAAVAIASEIKVPALKQDYVISGVITVNNSSQYLGKARQLDENAAGMTPVTTYKVVVNEVRSGSRHSVNTATTINGEQSVIRELLDADAHKFFLTNIQGSRRELYGHTFGDLESSTTRLLQPAMISELIQRPLAGHVSIVPVLRKLEKSDKIKKVDGGTTYSLSFEFGAQPAMMELIVDKDSNRVIETRQFAVPHAGSQVVVPFRTVSFDCRPDWAGTSRLTIKEYQQDSNKKTYVATQTQAEFTVGNVVPADFATSSLQKGHPAKSSDPVTMYADGGEAQLKFRGIAGQVSGK